MIIDTSVWIGLKHSRDRWHLQSKDLVPKILELERFYITDYILAETYNYLLRKVSSDVAMEVFKELISNSRCEILFNSEISLNGAREILEQYPRLSYTDANMVWHCRNLGRMEIMSFDQGFDGIKDVVRVYNK